MQNKILNERNDNWKTIEAAIKPNNSSWLAFGFEFGYRANRIVGYESCWTTEKYCQLFFQYFKLF